MLSYTCPELDSTGVGVSHRDPQSLRAIQGDVDTSTTWFLLVPLALLSLLMHVYTHTHTHTHTHRAQSKFD